MDATLGTASLACQVAVENAAQVFLASEQAAWAALPPAIEGSGGAVPSPQAVTYADPQQPRRPIGRGGIIDRIRGAAEGWKPVPVFPPKPGDPVQVWPPAIKIIGNKPKLIPIFEGPRGGTVGIVRGGVGVYLPPAIVVTSPGPFIRFPSGIIVKGVIGAEVGITGPKVAPKVIVEVPRP